MKPISRRQLVKAVAAAGIVPASLEVAHSNTVGGRRSHSDPSARRSASWDPAKIATPMMRDPVWVYDNWSAYAEGIEGLKDTKLTEALAMKQLRQVVRLKQSGVRFDYYMMNAFWFSPDGAYRQWRAPDWPSGPDQWIEGCQEHGLKPGMWFGTNSLWQINAAPRWLDSLAVKDESSKWPWQTLSLYEGGFLADFMEVLQYWYDRGIRMFEFDSANFDAATPKAHKTQSADEIRSRNQKALSDALKDFRRRNADAMLVAFNDFGGDINSTTGGFPFKKTVDLRWLEVFDTLYSGDTRASDVPQANFWRSVDLYNDHMVRRYEQNGIPLERIDPFCTFSSTWFGFQRGKAAWKGMLLLTIARGSWKKTIYGDLEHLNDEDARWFAKVQQMYEPLVAMGRTKTFGGIPGDVQPYGFGSVDGTGALYTVVNPTQALCTMDLPALSAAQRIGGSGRVLFRDAGFTPLLDTSRVTLGAGQMAVIGFGRYATAEHDLGIQDDVVIPRAIRPVQAKYATVGANAIEATLVAPERGNLRVFFQQQSSAGTPLRSKKLGRIDATQGGKALMIQSDLADKEVKAGGLSWSAGEIQRSAFTPGRPITIRYSLEADGPVLLQGQTYAVEY